MSRLKVILNIKVKRAGFFISCFWEQFWHFHQRPKYKGFLYNKLNFRQEVTQENAFLRFAVPVNLSRNYCILSLLSVHLPKIPKEIPQWSSAWLSLGQQKSSVCLVSKNQRQMLQLEHNFMRKPTPAKCWLRHYLLRWSLTNRITFPSFSFSDENRDFSFFRM